MTPEEIAKAQEVLTYATDQLRGLELKHQADPPAIFADLLTRLIETEFQVQIFKGRLKEVSDADEQYNQERAEDYREHDEVLAALWEGAPPEGIDHQATLELIAALHKRPGAVALASETEPKPDTEPGKTPPTKRRQAGRKASKPNERRTRKAADAILTAGKPRRAKPPGD